MKNLAVKLTSIILSLLLVRYYPNISREFLLEYIMAVYLSYRMGKLINNDAADLIHP